MSLYQRIAAAPEPTQVVAQYVWGARPGHRDELVFRDRDADGNGTLDERLYCLMDYFNPVAVVDAEGDVKERYAWSVYGIRSVIAPDWSERVGSLFVWDFGFHGQFLDGETGWYNYGYRYYSPEIGRWLSRDPIGERGGSVLYRSNYNNPIRYNDFLGLNDEEKILKIAFKGANLSDLSLIPDFWNSVDGTEYYTQYEGVEIFNSLKGDDAIERVREKVNESNCDLDLRIVGFSWGGWTALKVSHKLSEDEEIGEKLTIRLGLIDPVPKFREKDWGHKATKVVFLVNYFQSNGLLKKNGSYNRAFRGVSVVGADFELDAVTVFPDTNHLDILTRYGHTVLQQTFLS